MTGSSNFLWFNNTGTNQLSDGAYAASTQVNTGFTTGIAPSAVENKVLYQCSAMAYALGQLLASKGETISDSNPTALIASLGKIGGVNSMVPKSAGYTLAVGDRNNSFLCTSTFTMAFTAAATLGASWFIFIRNAGTGVITLDPNSTELIDGVQTMKMYPGEAFMITCDGTGFVTHGRQSSGEILLEAKTASNSSVLDFNKFITSDFDIYELRGAGLTPSTDGVTANIKVSTDAGSTYIAGTAYNTRVCDVSGGELFVTSASSMRIDRNTLGSADGEGMSFRIEFSKLGGAQAFKRAYWNTSSSDTNGNSDGTFGTGLVQTNAPITGIRFLFGSGNIASGSLKLFGIRG